MCASLSVADTTCRALGLNSFCSHAPLNSPFTYNIVRKVLHKFELLGMAQWGRQTDTDKQWHNSTRGTKSIVALQNMHTNILWWCRRALPSVRGEHLVADAAKLNDPWTTIIKGWPSTIRTSSVAALIRDPLTTDRSLLLLLLLMLSFDDVYTICIIGLLLLFCGFSRRHWSDHQFILRRIRVTSKWLTIYFQVWMNRIENYSDNLILEVIK